MKGSTMVGYDIFEQCPLCPLGLWVTERVFDLTIKVIFSLDIDFSDEF